MCSLGDHSSLRITKIWLLSACADPFLTVLNHLMMHILCVVLPFLVKLVKPQAYNTQCVQQEFGITRLTVLAALFSQLQ